MDPLIGRMLGSYEVIEAIGEGGMARIYKGLHPELKRYAAIKVINWGLQEDPEFTRRFRREAQVIANLRHPNIVQIFDFGKYDSGYFMVMEFIDGNDLAVILRRHREAQILLPPERVMHITKDVAAALDYAHRQGVIHRDVKPSNIMINQHDQAILTDFGLVMLSARKSQGTLGHTFGTPHYIAPEQAISSAAAVSASDIYSLAVIVYEMVTGQLLFDDESPLSVALKHISDVPIPPTSVNPNLPLAVEDIILTGLAKEPNDRFETAIDMALRLEAAWSGSSGEENGMPRSLASILPAGVPSASEVARLTLPNPTSRSAPMIPPLEPAQLQADKPGDHKNDRPGWLLLLLVGLGGVVVGALALALSQALRPAGPAVTPLVAVVEPTRTPTSTPPVVPTTPAASAADFVPASPSPLPAITETPTVAPTPTPRPTPARTATATASPTPEPTLTLTPTTSPSPTLLPTATPSPTGGVLTLEQLRNKILFKTDRSGRVEIYQMEADGSNQKPLPQESWSLYTELQAALPYSPNGREMVATRGEGQLDLWRVDLVDGHELRVTSTQKAEYDPAWSPVDNRIVYVSEETGNGDIYLLNLDGSAVLRLTNNVDDFDKHPTWSPDGTRVAFWSNMGFNKTRQIWVIDLPTNVITSLSDNPFNDWDPVWVH